MDFDKSMLIEFAAESLDHLGNIEEDILLLSGAKGDLISERIDNIFRSIHSIKGASGFLSLVKIEKISHVMENLLSALRSKNISLDKEVINTLLEGVDILIHMLNNVEISNETDISNICSRLNSLLEKSDTRDDPQVFKTDFEINGQGEAEIGFEINKIVLENISPEYNYLYILKYDLDELRRKDEVSPVSLVRELLNCGEILDARLWVEPTDLFKGLPQGPVNYFVLYASYLTHEVILTTQGLSHDRVIPIDRKKFLESQKEKEEEQFLPQMEKDDPGGFIKCSQHDIRIEIDKLDMLINLVGELVISESMVTNNKDLADLELENFEHASRNHRRIISELQDVAMSMRMIPLTQTFRKLTRLVHDLSSRLEKKCRLELSGEETELDKTVIEQITDPLIHIVRNCLDHGIECPEKRKRKSKPQTGTIKITARHQGGEVVICISDDGSGLDPEKILLTAREKNLISKHEKYLKEQDIFHLIFIPGFSTSARITDVSGRGVGLDVVKRNIEKLKGKVDIHSKPGQGTFFLLRIPLTMAIIEGMLVKVGSMSYTLPLLSIRESFRPSPKQITITMEGQEIVRIRDELIPVLRLHNFYNIIPEKTELTKGILIHAAFGTKNICLFVDEIIGHHQTVIKSMPNYVSSVRGVSGCTILSHGEVSLILDVGNIIELSENNS
ncbi:Putative chemotaxis protein, CheA-like [Desulfonema limicola]|uniref:Chemotaxis protein CheA n=1 Tax=Desulfonema limicola TaxID=45656 RepID=A0A975GHV6_9BACT|nr:chemotaxis protein CheA [Desulfonema limicola]QTA81118.1 Putative chemotaxis protein, CheA-like [Desulfonema limicola]